MKCSDPLGVNAMVPKLSISRLLRTSDSILASSSHEVWRRRRREDDYSTFKARESGVRHRVYRLRNRGKSSPRRCDVCDGETSFMPPNLTLNHNLKKRLFLDIDSHFRIFQKRNGLRKEERGHSTFSRHWVFRSFCPGGILAAAIMSIHFLMSSETTLFGTHGLHRWNLSKCFLRQSGPTRFYRCKKAFCCYTEKKD